MLSVGCLAFGVRGSGFGLVQREQAPALQGASHGGSVAVLSLGIWARVFRVRFEARVGDEAGCLHAGPEVAGDGATGNAYNEVVSSLRTWSVDGWSGALK